MNRKDFVNTVFDQLEKNHVYLYHDISKQDFEIQKQKFLHTVDNLDEVHFEAGMLKLFALFKESHLFYNDVPLPRNNAQIVVVGKNFYIKNNDKFEKIVKINGQEFEKVTKQLMKLIPYEVKDWAYFRLANEFLNSPKALEMIDLQKSCDTITYQTESGGKMTLATEKIAKTPLPAYSQQKFLNDNVLYIKYLKCRDMPDYPFKNFIKDIADNLTKKPQACIVDLRNNGGGNDLVIMPLIDFLRQTKIKTFALINAGTFSSGTFAIAALKNVGATLVGTNAGMGTKAYGNINTIQVDDKSFTFSTRYFELTKTHGKSPVKPYDLPKEYRVFDYDGVIKPDIKIEMKIDDLNNGVDTQLNFVLEQIKKELTKQNEKQL